MWLKNTIQVDIDKVLSVLYATEDVPPEDEESIVDEHNENIQAEPEQEVEEVRFVRLFGLESLQRH